MSEIFWESEHKARKQYFCSWCFNYIEPGSIYSRKIWAPRGTRSFHVMCEHVSPHCPPNEGELHMLEMIREERVALGVPIAFVLQAKQVLLVQVDGSIVTHTEMEAVPIIGSAIAMSEEQNNGDYDEEIPF